jgi:hypothetical protein
VAPQPGTCRPRALERDPTAGSVRRRRGRRRSTAPTVVGVRVRLAGWRSRTSEHHRQEYHRQDKHEVNQPEYVDSAALCVARHSESLTRGEHLFQRSERIAVQAAIRVPAHDLQHLVGPERRPVRPLRAERFGHVGYREDPRGLIELRGG